LEEGEGVGGGAGEGVLVQDLFGQGADQGFAAQGAAILFVRTLDEVVDMEGAFGGHEYIIYYIHIRLTLGFGLYGRTVFGAAESAQGAELSQRRCFKDIDEIIFIDWVHGKKKDLP
jgi:hypothetical protein